MTQQKQGAMGSTQHTKFPPAEWFHPDINPKIVQALREIYQVYCVDPSHLYGERAQRILSARSTEVYRGNRLTTVISCMWQAANDRKAQLQAGNTRNNMCQSMGDSQPWDVYEGAARNLAPAFRQASAEGGGAGLNTYAHPQAVADPDVPGTGSTESMRVSEVPVIFDQQHESLMAWRVGRQQQEPAASDLSQPQASLSAAAPTPPQVRAFEATARAPASAAVEHASSTPTRRPLSRASSSPALTSRSREDGRDRLSKRQYNQKKAIDSFGFCFTPRSYLIPFIEQVQEQLDRAKDLTQADKALLIKKMLGEEVIHMLTGHHALDHPSEPEQMWHMLTDAFPPNPEALMMALAECKQAPKEPAAAFLLRCKAMHVEHQCQLPDSLTTQGMSQVILNCHARFASYIRSQKRAHETAMVTLSRLQNVPAMPFELSWQQLTTLASNFDLEYSVHVQRNRREMETRMAAKAQPRPSSYIKACLSQATSGPASSERSAVHVVQEQEKGSGLHPADSEQTSADAQALPMSFPSSPFGMWYPSDSDQSSEDSA